MDGSNGLRLGSERGGSMAAGWARSTNRGRWAIGDVGLRVSEDDVGLWVGEGNVGGLWWRAVPMSVTSREWEVERLAGVKRVRGWKWVRDRWKKKKEASCTWGIKNYFLFLDVSYSAHLSIDVHCSNSATKFSYSSATANEFFVFWHI